MRELSYNRLLEYPSNEVDYGYLDPNIQIIFKEQDFIQIILRYLVSLFRTVESLYEFSKVYLLYKREMEEKNEDEEGFKIEADAIVVQTTKEIPLILSHKDRIRIEIDIKKREILLMCYSILEAICTDNEINQNFLLQYLPIMQMHSFFFPEVILSIGKLFCSNQEILLKIKKKSEYSSKTKVESGLNKANGFDLIELSSIDNQAKLLVNSFNLAEGITSGASNIFYFFGYYLLKTEALEIRQKILELFTKLSVFGNESISINQDEIFFQIKNNFKDLIRTQFYTMSSRDTDLMIINPVNLKALSLSSIFSNDNGVQKEIGSSPKWKGDPSNFEEKAEELKGLTKGEPVEQDSLNFSDLEDENKPLTTTLQDMENKLAEVPFQTVPNFTEESIDPRIKTQTAGDQTSDQRNLVIFEQDDIKSSRYRGGLDQNLKFTQEQKFFILIQLNFYAGMVLDRNFIWKDMIEQNGFFSLEVLLHNLLHRYDSFEVNASLLRILQHMFVDQPPMYSMLVPQYCKVVGGFNDDDGDLSPTLKDSQKTEKRPLGYNLDVQLSHSEVSKVQKKIISYFLELKNAIKLLPLTFEELRDPEKFDKYKEHQEMIINQFTLEMAKTVLLLFEFGQYRLKVLPSQQKYMTHLLLKAEQETNIIPLLRVMVRLLEFEPEYPEAKVLLYTLKKAMLKMKSNDKFVEEFNNDLKAFKYSEAYDKIIMVEDVEKKEDEAYYMFETYFRQYVIKDISFKTYFKYRNFTLEQIKSVIMSILEVVLAYIADSYTNRVTEVFENTVKGSNLIERIVSREFIEDISPLHDIFMGAIEGNLDRMMPPIASTGLSLDFNDSNLKDQSHVLTNSFDLNTLVGQSLFPSLLLLFSFNQESEILSSKSIELLIKVFSQRVQILRNLKNVTVINGKDDTKQIQKIKKDLHSLTDLCDNSEVWIRSPDNEIRMSNLIKVVNRIDWFCRLLSVPPSENMGAPNITEIDSFAIDTYIQEMFRNLKAYLCITDFIRDTLGLLAEDYEAATDPQIIFYFQILFLFLRKFCYKNKKNQSLLAKEITVFIQECPVDVGQASLIIEIYKDNETMCKTMQSLVTDDFIKWILKSGRRERFIDFFLNLMKCNDTFLLDNQRKVLQLFLDHPRKAELLYVTQEASQTSGESETRMLLQAKQDTENRFYYDEPYRYHAKILRLFTYACAGKSSVVVNEVKVKNLFKLSYLLEILTYQDALTDPEEYENDFAIVEIEKEGDNPKPMTNFQLLLQSPYIQKRKEMGAEDNSKFDLENPPSPKRDRFNLKVKGITSPKPKRVTVPKRRDRMRTTLIGEFQRKRAGGKRVINLLKISVIELLYFVYFESATISEDVISYAGVFVKLFRVETERLKHLEKDNITPDYIEFLFGNLLRMAVAVESSLMKEKSVLEDEELSTFKMSDFVNEFANKFELFSDEEIVKYIQEINGITRMFNFDLGPRVSKLSKREAEPSIHEAIPKAEKSDIWRYLWQQFIDTISESDKIKDQVHSEKQVLSRALNQIEDLFKIPIIHSPDIEAKVKKILINVNKKRIIRSIIAFVVDNYREQNRINTISEVLYCLGGMIPLNEEGMVDEDNDEAVKKEQSFLEECGATGMVMKQVSDPMQTIVADDYNLNLFRFAIRLLKGGNKYIQGEFFEYMRTESSAEVFFSKIYYVFQKETEYINKDQISPDISIVLSILELIQHFAEGHNQNLQLYMRSQTNSLRSYNLLEEVVTLLSSYLTCKKYQYFELILQCFDTITELIQGPCFENQQFLMQGRMMETVSKLLSIDEFYLIEAENRKLGDPLSKDNLRPWMIAKIKHKCSITLISLVECQLDRIVLSKMYTNLKKFLFDNIISFYINFKKIYDTEYNEEALEHVEVKPEDGKDELYCSVIIQTAFNYYTIIQKNFEDNDEESSSEEEQEEKIDDKLDEEKRELDENETAAIPEPLTLEDLKRYLEYHRVKNKAPAFTFMKSKTRTIEVVREDEYLEKVYFLTVPYFESITDNIKDDFNLEVSRISCKTKCNDLLEASDRLLAQLRRERDILKNPVLRQVLKNYNLIKISSYIFVLAVNLIAISTYMQAAPSDVESPTSAVDQTESWVYLTQRVLGGIIIFHGILILVFDTYRETPVVKSVFHSDGFLKALEFAVTEKVSVLYYLFYVGIAVLGLFYPAWFSFLMNDILNINQVLKNIVKSVWRPKSSIALTLIFFIVIMYAFSSMGFVLLGDIYANSMPNKLPCKNIFECFLLTIDKGMKFDGGIGNYLDDHNENTDTSGRYIPVSIGKFVFQNLFLLIDFIIVLSIVTGIIIDTFGSLREEYNEYIEDTETFCFICGFERETLDKESEEKDGFDFHVKNEHYQWNYLFYIGYLSDKEATELTGLESYIAGLIEKEKIDWFPNHRAMMIKEDDGLEAGEAVDANLEDIEKNHQNIDMLTLQLKKNLVLYQNLRESKKAV